MMTIQQFAFRTGLSPHTLRYYDKKGLLIPATRMENGYRAYAEEQIPNARLIHSLRQAHVPIEELQAFLLASAEEQAWFIHKWRKAAEASLLSIQIAKKYLDGIEPEHTRIHLTKWDTPVHMLWLSHKEEKSIVDSLYDMIERDQQKIAFLGLSIYPYSYVKTIESGSSSWAGEVGFQLETCPSLEIESRLINAAIDWRLEVIPATLFAVMECSTEDQYTCFAYIHFVKRYGFEPIGDKIECYNLADRSKYQLMIPILSLQ